MYGKLSIHRAPPLSVPIRFFLTAPLFGILAALILLVTGPDVLASRWTPGMLALTHCLTLGFFASIMIGAVQQLLPVLAGSVFPRPRLTATIIYVLWLPGVILLIVAFFNFKPVLVISALILLSAAILFFVSTALYSLLNAPVAVESIQGIAFAVLSLFVTFIFGFLLALGYTGVVPLWRPALTNLHLAWGIVGWISVLIMVVAWQVLPMFQITRPYPVLLRNLTVPGACFLLLAKTMFAWTGHTAPGLFSGHIIDLALVTGFLCFALVTLYLQLVSSRRARDSHRDFWVLAMLNLVLSLSLWLAAGIYPNPLFYLLAGAVFLLGFVMAIVTAMVLKITAFLIWLHLRTLVDEHRMDKDQHKFSIPKMKYIITDTRGYILLASLVFAESGIIAAVCNPRMMTAAAAIAWLIFFCLLAAVLTSTVYRYYRTVRIFTREYGTGVTPQAHPRNC